MSNKNIKHNINILQEKIRIFHLFYVFITNLWRIEYIVAINIEPVGKWMEINVYFVVISQIKEC